MNWMGSVARVRGRGFGMHAMHHAREYARKKTKQKALQKHMNEAINHRVLTSFIYLLHA